MTNAPGSALRAALCAMYLGLAACSPAWAQTATPSVQDIIDQLAPPPSAARPASTPGRALPPTPTTTPVPAPAASAAAAAAPAASAAAPLEGKAAAGPPPPSMPRNLRPVQRRIDLVVPFEFNSSTFGTAAEAVLQQLALAMQSERLRPVRFLIEGHTDAKGSAEYNDRLSEQRARSVAGYLVQQGVAAERLTAVGRGFREPLAGEDPLSPVNRRVRIIALE